MTKKMPGLFAKHPPRQPLDSLDAIIDDWIYRFGKNGLSKEMRDEVVDYCARARDFDTAVERACNSRRPNGKVHNHQSRVPAVTRLRFCELILTDKKIIKVIKNFDDLYDHLETIAPDGIGPVTLYDVATRIAAYMKLEVQSLYLHAGVRIGWCLLHGKRSPNQLRLPRGQLPKPFHRISTDEVEDLLCAYREFFKPWYKESI